LAETGFFNNWKNGYIPPTSTVSGDTPDPNQGFKAGGKTPPTDPNAILLYEMDEPSRKATAQALKDAGYKVAVNGKFTQALVEAYTNAVQAAAVQSQQLGREVKVSEFLVQEASGRPAGADANKPYLQTSVSDTTQAASIINPIIKNVLGREATPKETAALTKVLNDAENKNPYITTKGRTVGGFDRTQFLTDLIKTGKYLDPKTGKPATIDSKIASAVKSISKFGPEIQKRVKETEGLDAQTIRATARANMLELSDVQVNNFLADLKAGQDIKTINSRIRNIAAMGMPDSIKQMVAEGTDLDTIYQPYKTRMASILEINPESININDATLRSAIGPDKEMPLYEFEKALRKDSRWQYTNNARDKVSEISARIRRDFGFEA
jgi:hypothetical protein